jgi:hypothetical protein
MAKIRVGEIAGSSMDVPIMFSWSQGWFGNLKEVVRSRIGLKWTTIVRQARANPQLSL